MKHRDVVQSIKTEHIALALLDAVTSMITLWIAVSIRNEEWFIPTSTAVPQIGLALIGAPLIISLLGCYRSLDISLSYQNVLGLAKAATLFGGLFLAASLYLHPTGIPRSVGLIYPLMFLTSLLFSRGMIEHFSSISNKMTKDLKRKKIFIYGAGQAGKSILAFLRNQPWTVEAFLDDDTAKIGREFHHIPIKAPSSLQPADTAGVPTVLLALPSIDGSRRAEIYQYLASLGYEVLTIPTLSQMALNGSNFADFRGIKIDDLLERAVVHPNVELMSANVKGKTVLVTGAGGSIGAELSRQILGLGASRLILLDHSEFHLFEVDRKLRDERDLSASDCELVAFLASTCSESDVSMIFSCYSIDVVFHAAAYKHVHLLEKNEFRGLYNNIIGTKLIVNACLAHEVATMVLISTDKAVRPTSVMGMSKRIAELVVESAQAKSVATKSKFATVRFGNVLGSNGSVVPIFEKQIERGGPVTVTDPLVTRYFMTIAEASSLVIQASAMAEDYRGVFVLDMGAPVQITLLAERLIEMAGKRPVYCTPTYADEIEITFTGLKGGEKLCEELFISVAKPMHTAHPRILVADSTNFGDEISNKLEIFYQTLETCKRPIERDWRPFLVEFLSLVDGY